MRDVEKLPAEFPGVVIGKLSYRYWSNPTPMSFVGTFPTSGNGIHSLVAWVKVNGKVEFFVQARCVILGNWDSRTQIYIPQWNFTVGRWLIEKDSDLSAQIGPKHYQISDAEGECPLRWCATGPNLSDWWSATHLFIVKTRFNTEVLFSHDPACSREAVIRVIVVLYKK